MATVLEISRVERRTRTYDLAPLFPGLNLTGATASVALLPKNGNPTAATVWTTATYASGSVTVLLAGPDADSTGALVVPASADLWVKVDATPQVDAAKLERVTVLGGGAVLVTPTGVPVVSVNGKTGAAVVLSPGDVGAQPSATLAADTAAHIGDGSALDVALEAAYAPDIARNTRALTPPTFYRANSGQPILTAADQHVAPDALAPGAAISVYWPYVIDARRILGVTAIDEWYMYYSTDHAAVHSTSGIFLATAPTLLGPWTGRGRVYRDDAGGQQTETPAVFADPAGTNKLIMLYQQDATPGAVGAQSTLYATSNDGIVWTRGGIAIDIPTWWPSDGHTGYARPQNLGGELTAYHLAGGWDFPTFARSHSFDGRTWWMEHTPLAYAVDMIGDGRRMEWNSVDVFWRNGSPWALANASGWTSGSAISDARIIAVPLSRDLRRIIGKPTVLLYPTQGTESTNYKGHHLITGRDGYLYLFYNCAGSIFVATTKEP